MIQKLIIYEKASDLHKLDSKIIEGSIIHKDKIYLIYDAKIVSPPFFKLIIILKELTENDIKMVYNMLLVGGKLLFSETMLQPFLKLRLNHSQFDFSLKEDNYISVIKKNNFQFIFDSHRTIEFIIIGAQKGGTTSLSLNIAKHPDIYINKNEDPRIAEPHFFDIYWYKGIEFYKKKNNYSKQIVGEKTPDLMYLPHTFPMIQSINPYVKFIIILRNPIHRAYSAWKLNVKYFDEKKTFHEAIENEMLYKQHEVKTFYTSITHYLQRGLYYQQIKELYKWFPKQNILILLSENVKNNMETEYNKVYQFLNLSPLDNVAYNTHFESDSKDTIHPMLYEKLKLFFINDVKKLEKLINMQTGWF
jgi:hypothetical protein